MGTRGAFGVRIDNTDKVTYNHFDSYPAHLGVNLLDQVKAIINKLGLSGLKQLARELRLVDANSIPSEFDIQRLREYLDTAVSTGSANEWYALLRDLHGELGEILTKAKVMIDNSNFLDDSLFCEYAYIFNLDSNELEVYEGFQKSRPKHSRYKKGPDSSGYYSVELIKSYSLDNLPSREQFLGDLEEEESA